MTCAYQLAFYPCKMPIELLAVVRYTAYDDEGKVSLVDTVEYPNDYAGRQSFELQLIASLECSVDVTVLSHIDVRKFPKLQKLLDQ